MEQSIEVRELERVQEIQVVKVVDEITREQANNVILDLKSKRKKVVEYWKPLKQKADEAKRELLQKEKQMLNIIDPLINKQSDEVKAYIREQERKRAEARAKAEAEARAKAEEERKQREAEQEKAIEEGDIEKAMAIDEEIVPEIVMPKVSSMPAKTTRTDFGTTTVTKDIKVEIKDINVFMMYCAEKGLVDLWEVKVGKVKKWVKDNGHTDIPGLEISEDINLAHRAAQ